MTNYIEFSAKIKEKYPEYKDIDDLTLAQKMVEKYPQYKEQVTFENVNPSPQPSPKKGEGASRGIDLTPSGIPKMLAAGIAAPIQAIKDKSNLADAYNTVRNEINTNPIYKHPVQDFATDMLGYSALPMLRGGGALNFLGNAAIQGGVPGALETMKRGGNAAVGAGAGTGIATILQGLPYAGKLTGKPAKYITNKAIEGLTDVKPETLKQVIKPNSQALDLTEDTAQNLLMNTTERVRDAYNNLLEQAGQKVAEATQNLPKNYYVPKENLQQALENIYNSYSVSGDKALNVARNEAGKIYNNINDLIEKASDIQSVIPARELKDILNNISAKTQWDKPGAQLQNEILERLYGNYNSMLSSLSPELSQANAVYSALKNFEKNEGLRRILRKGDNIDTASSALRNYNSTVTKGNTGRNIQELEKTLVNSGEKPFLNDIDDVNAAMDLLTQPKTGRNFLGAQTLAKGLVTPALKAIREANRAEIPQKIQTLKQVLEPIGKLMPALGAKGAANMLYGGVEYNDYR